MTTTVGSGRRDTALREVLAAIAYGEWKAHEGAKQSAAEADDDAEVRALRNIAAEELRHYKGFVRRLEALGADPERAMSKYRRMLDRFHAAEPPDDLTAAVWSYLGEGVADDLLSWLRTVVDPETAEFVDSVIADEVGHEARATEELHRLMATTPDGRRRAGAAARSWLRQMAIGGERAPTSLMSFLRVGRPDALLASIVGGYARRMWRLGLMPSGRVRIFWRPEHAAA